MKLYIGNISYEATEADIRQAFEKYSSLVDCYYPEDKYSGKPRGFAFVTLEDDAEAESAIKEMNEHEIMGRQIVVSEAREKRDNGGGGGGGGRRNSGGGGRRNNYNDRRGGGGGGRY